MTLGEESYTRHKNRVKRARTLVEIAFVVAALYLLYTLFSWKDIPALYRESGEPHDRYGLHRAFVLRR